MQWTDIEITVPQAYAGTAEAIATMVANGGIYIEDYSDLEQQAWEIAHVDLIEQELLDKPRDVVKVHMYLAPDENPAEVLPLFKERLEASGIPYELATNGVEQEDWQNAWKKYYHAMDIGKRLAIVARVGTVRHRPHRDSRWTRAWRSAPARTRRPRCAWRCWTSGCAAASVCWTSAPGRAFLAIAALKLGAAAAEGVDIDPMCVRTAGENAARNGVEDRLTVLVGDLSDKASGVYDLITANIVAAAHPEPGPACARAAGAGRGVHRLRHY